MASEVVAISNRGASHLPDPIGIPTVISSTPGGTLYSTTPGGTRITYDRRTLLQYRNSLLSRTPPTDILAIPGITVPKDDSEQLSPPEHINCNDNLNLDNYVVNFNFKFYPANKNGVCKKKSKEKCKGESPQAIDTMNFYNKKFSKMTVFGDSNKSPKRNKEQHKEPHREPHKEPHKEPHREQHREPNKEPHREPNKEQHREPNKEQHREPHKEQNKEPSKQQHREPNREQHREPSKQQHREPNKQQHREPHPTKQTLFKKMNEKENDGRFSTCRMGKFSKMQQKIICI